MSNSFAHLPYRPCAGIMLLNREGLVFVGQRADSSADAWQMPQGGVDKGEDPLDAAIREVGEETGIRADLIRLIAQSSEERFYDLPDDLIGKLWKGKYRGQRQIWFLMRFLGHDDDVNIMTEHQEFRAWRWAEPEQVPQLIVSFKQALYHDILDEFRPLIGPAE
ncbi:RNA pyrophosphohydrolase [Aquisediminimonas sediminicola]|uniref:RNA pyrophosphohydrolase n=1 Tax=Alteraquisediminimonas sediminicola TaxID=2676787 RepID=UPI001C8EEBC7|nr:RNA pyrophosphohydrolase [Aquisediminimonas sediminicola]